MFFWMVSHMGLLESSIKILMCTKEACSEIDLTVWENVLLPMALLFLHIGIMVLSGKISIYMKFIRFLKDNHCLPIWILKSKQHGKLKENSTWQSIKMMEFYWSRQNFNHRIKWILSKMKINGIGVKLQLLILIKWMVLVN